MTKHAKRTLWQFEYLGISTTSLKYGRSFEVWREALNMIIEVDSKPQIRFESPPEADRFGLKAESAGGG